MLKAAPRTKQFIRVKQWDGEGSPRAQGAALRTRKGLVPWPSCRALPGPVPAGSRKRNSGPFSSTGGWSVDLMSRDVSRHILDRKKRGLRYSTVPL